MAKAVAAKNWGGLLHEWGDGTLRTVEESELTPGVWLNITPPEVDLEDTYGASTIAIDPSNPNVLYATFDQNGLWKSTDRGATWAELGSGTASSGTTTTRLDSPVCIAVDPTDSNHLVATQGIRGTSLGFWKSTDGGANWTRPAGFNSVAPTTDVTTLAIDPTDWNHMLLGSHSPWGGSPAGILETFDAGVTWTAHAAESSWPAGSMSLSILHHPTLDIGTSATWMAHTDGDGIWRTTNSGGSWTQVSEFNMSHGMVHPSYYAPDGTLYAGGVSYPVKSTDNGVTWTQMTDLANSYYMAVGGHGTTLYTRVSTPLLGGFGSGGFKVSTDDGANWDDQPSPGNQSLSNGPLCFVHDDVNGILYAACWDAGLWALKVA